MCKLKVIDNYLRFLFTELDSHNKSVRAKVIFSYIRYGFSNEYVATDCRPTNNKIKVKMLKFHE